MPSKSPHSLFLCYCFHYLDMKVGKRKKNCLSFSRGVSPITEKHASTHNSQTLTHNENQEVRKGGGVERPSPQKQNVPINLGPAGHIHIRLKDFLYPGKGINLFNRAPFSAVLSQSKGCYILKLTNNLLIKLLIHLRNFLTPLFHASAPIVA